MTENHARAATSSDFDQLVYLRVFEGCNLYCRHCFIPKNPKKMESEQFAQVPEMLAGKIQDGQSILIQFHGGEPTLIGVNNMRNAIHSIRENGKNNEWHFGIQSNLMNLNNEWIKLYHEEFGGEVGVSWDYNIRQLNKHARESNKVFDQKFWNNFSKIVSEGLKPFLVVTATRILFENLRPMEFFDYLVSKGVTRLHLERITKTGYARENWNELGLNNAEYSNYLSKWLRSYILWQKKFDGTPVPLQISPLDEYLWSAEKATTGAVGGYGCLSGKCDTSFHTIDSDGYKRGCTALTSEIDNRNAIDKLFIPDLQKAREERKWNCKTCQFKTVCSAGCLAILRDDGSGECPGGYRIFQTALNGLQFQ